MQTMEGIQLNVFCGINYSRTDTATIQMLSYKYISYKRLLTERLSGVSGKKKILNFKRLVGFSQFREHKKVRLSITVLQNDFTIVWYL